MDHVNLMSVPRKRMGQTMNEYPIATEVERRIKGCDHAKAHGWPTLDANGCCRIPKHILQIRPDYPLAGKQKSRERNRKKDQGCSSAAGPCARYETSLEKGSQGRGSKTLLDAMPAYRDCGARRRRGRNANAHGEIPRIGNAFCDEPESWSPWPVLRPSPAKRDEQSSPNILRR